MAKIKISEKLGSEILSVVAEVSELLHEEEVSSYSPVESDLQHRLSEVSRKVFNKLMGLPKDAE